MGNVTLDQCSKYGMVCLTGLLGCRWSHTKQTTPGNKRAIGSWTILLLAALYITFYVYFFLVARNDENDLNYYMYTETDSLIPWYTISLALSSTLFSYVLLIVILALCHVISGHRMYIHLLHLILLLLVLSGCAVLTWVLTDIWLTEWTILYVSLQIIGPFLQIGAVCFMTILSWVIIQQWLLINSFFWKVVWACVLISLMIGLYISPIFIHSPCVVEADRLPRKPKMFAHRGASAIAPENTAIAFQKAIDVGVYGLETDVTISLDGIPFLFHGNDLRMTSNVDSVFPDLMHQRSALFNLSQLKSLDTGTWFLQRDPLHTVDELTDADRVVYQKQTIMSFREFLVLAKDHNVEVMFDINHPPLSNPFYNQTIALIRADINQTGFPEEKVWWLKDENSGFQEKFRYTSRGVYPLSYLQTEQLTALNVQPAQITEHQILDYQLRGITTNIFTVNARWLYSFYWCLGVDSVTSNFVHDLMSMSTPIWHMPPESYLTLWIVVDLSSAIIIAMLFVVQCVCLRRHRYRVTKAIGQTAATDI